MGDAVPLRFLTYLAPCMTSVYRAVADAVAAQLGRTATVTASADLRALERGEADLAFMCSPPYLWLADRARPIVEAIAAPVLTDPDAGGRPAYFSDVIVRRDAPFASFEDLRGGSFAYNESWSHSGYGVVEHHLAEIGATDAFFERVVASGLHQRSIRLVASGGVDAAAIDRQVLWIERRRHPGLAERIRVIDALGPSTIQPVVASTSLPARVRAELRSAFASLHEDRALAAPFAFGFVARFVAVDDAAYDDVREMRRRVAQAGVRGFGPGNPASPGTLTV